MELSAHTNYSGLKYPVSYWRTASQLEVDFVLGNHEVAIFSRTGPGSFRRLLDDLT
ncbi:MAG: DUF4143 domain-containing protein [Deltaproteobacteria bacterium]|nr:DUF4143 domain-containing protein [Deltaproteobacteria bacterium]